MLSQKTQYIFRPIIISLTVILLISGLYAKAVFSPFEGIMYDWLMSETRADLSTHEDVAIIIIDDASLSAMDNYAGRWPWPRFVYADLLEFLAMANPKGIMFDTTFTEKHTFNADDGETINQADQELVNAVASYPSVYQAVRFVFDSLAADESQNVTLNKALPTGVEQRFSIQHRQLYEDSLKIKVDGLQAPANNNYYLPFPELLNAAQGIGVVEVQADKDSVYRRARLFHNYQDLFFPGLSITALIDQQQPKVIERIGNFITLDETRIPVDNEEKVLINYYGKFNTYSFSGIIASLANIQAGNLESLLIDPAEFDNKYVFIGASASGLNDLKNTPIDARLPGVMIHASIASNVLNDEFLTPPNAPISYTLIILFSLTTVLCVLFIKQAVLKNGIPLAIAIGYMAFTYFMFEQNVVFELVAPLTALALSWVVSFSALVLMEGREKRKFKKMMSQYLSPAVLRTAVDNHEEFVKAEVGSQENLSILFSDIRNFTNLSEKLQAEQVVEILNYYFSSMTDSIFHYEGTIDKFIGDAIMAFWGAPIKTADHAEKATRSAIDMVRRLEEVNQWLIAKNLEPIAIGIGIHTGDAILGNIGSENKLDYTIIGDNVNLASRIEGLTKHYGTTILITEDTYSQLVNPIPCFVADLVAVKGKKKPIKVFQPLILPEDPDEDIVAKAHALQKINETMFEHYLKQEWQQALAELTQLPKDPLHNNFRQRCRANLNKPTLENWDGVHTMTSK